MRAIKGGRKARAEGKGTPELVGVEFDTTASVRQWRPKLGQPAAFRMGLSGGKDGGGRGLRKARNSTRFCAIKLPQSICEETAVRGVTPVREVEDE